MRRKPLGIAFPTGFEEALRNAEETRRLSVSQRYESLLALLRTVERISEEGPLRERQIAEHDRRKREELEALVRVQVRGHV
jgi:hypothetical protein